MCGGVDVPSASCSWGDISVLFLGLETLTAEAPPDQELLIVSLLRALRDFNFPINCISLNNGFLRDHRLVCA